MCVPIITDEIIEAGELKVDYSGLGINLVVKDSDGHLVANNTYGYATEHNRGESTTKFFRMFKGGNMYPIKLQFVVKGGAWYGDLVVEATHVDTFSKYEVKALAEVVFGRDFEDMEVKTNKYGIATLMKLTSKGVDYFDDDEYDDIPAPAMVEL